MYEPNEQYYVEPRVTEREVAVHLSKVMGWMSLGLLTTFASAMLCLAVPVVYQAVFSNPINLYVILFAQLGVVIALSRGLNHFSATMATVLFMTYSALTGVTFSTLALVFELSSIVTAFAVTAGVFLTMSLYGFVTKRDLSRFGSIAFMALIGLLLSTLVNMFLGNAMLDFIICIAGVLIFTGLTAWDVQRIKASFVGATQTGLEEGSGEMQKLAIHGALNLYLDFINLFLYLLRLFGQRK